MNNKKKKITTVVLLFAFLAIAVTGGTLAYFTDTESDSHTYTTGNVEIALTDGDASLANEHLYPTMVLAKNPTIENVGDENAYIAAKVTITSNGNLHTYTKADGSTGYLLGLSNAYDNIDISALVSGGLADATDLTIEHGYHGTIMVHKNAEYALYQDADKANNKYVLYFFIEAPKATTDKVVLFERLTIPAEWDNAEMDQLKGLEITVDAFGVQEYGFTSCYDAMTTAFPGEFAF